MCVLPVIKDQAFDEPCQPFYDFLGGLVVFVHDLVAAKDRVGGEVQCGAVVSDELHDLAGIVEGILWVLYAPLIDLRVEVNDDIGNVVELVHQRRVVARHCCFLFVWQKPKPKPKQKTGEKA